MKLSVKDTAELLAVTEETVYRWIKQADIPFYKIHEEYRFNQTEIRAWATARQMKISPNIFLADETSHALLPSLLEAVNNGGIIYQLGGCDLETVLRNLVGALVLPADFDREFLSQVLLARESLGSTAIGNGIAIPHVRNPVVLHVTRPSVTLCFLENPIDFKALDGKPVNILFTLISTTTRCHLHLLSRISFVLHNQALRESLLRQAPRAELLALLALAEAEIPN
ncbi:MAG: PTS sugar transporter subunit IIA [Deltaproteobacteria bacterium]|nr:PTS sugar transporter subunit IIA [Deltaproteobacteria bacterium]